MQISKVSHSETIGKASGVLTLNINMVLLVLGEPSCIALFSFNVSNPELMNWDIVIFIPCAYREETEAQGREKGFNQAERIPEFMSNPALPSVVEKQQLRNLSHNETSDI